MSDLGDENIHKIRAVVDTNVAIVANNKSPQASRECVQQCIKRLEDLKQNGIVILDSEWRIIKEYQNELCDHGKLDAGDEFLVWILKNRKNPEKSELYSLHADPENEGSFLEFPKDTGLEKFHRKDRKFVAVAIVSGAPIWNAADSDWWMYKEALERNHIKVEFLCPDCF